MQRKFSETLAFIQGDLKMLISVFSNIIVIFNKNVKSLNGELIDLIIFVIK